MDGNAPDFAAASHAALADPQLRGNFRRAMDGLMSKRAAQFADAGEWTGVRALAASVRLRALSKLPELLEKLEETCTRNGITVHWAATTEEANAIALDILHRVDAKLVVKGKSMVTEEMHLNAVLEKDGIEVLDAIKREQHDLPVVMISGHGTVETAVASIKKGAYDFIEKPFKADRLLHVVERALEAERPCGEVLQLLASIRGALTGLTGEVMEDHLHEHVLHAESEEARRQAVDEIADVLKTYLR